MLPQEEAARFRARAAKVLGGTPYEVRWPYGLSFPERGLKARDPERYDNLLLVAERARVVIVGWAERYGLKVSEKACCPRWLRGKVSRSCETRVCAYSTEHSWLDHPLGWLRDGRPAALTSAPYHIRPDDRERINAWAAGEPPLGVAFGEGWYGVGTTQIVLWRPDRVEEVEPAVAGWKELGL